ncbi:hypothetical protein [Clostridium neonatale]|uniref:Uncharacterized protein n=1 Tax=Clostridium neonatale TaxID=137838 RepID=A0AAD2DIB1_9CLOT|nr:hypothetical protein [Clostridium neonatale]CAI3192045.1 conserved hypothetical protein [Clostridium neonatale]CAI3192184.1 conserved hypothetical protein [Clostridium neonatale]CAI3203095.1 conserved hypothetical protein [Clostridium neonatale]CAI3224616.1 conserved hypothetical protein [Clostridium neonatale]CAI3226249.1 conserved hypothetical protein [Clostridium neonatale]
MSISISRLQQKAVAVDGLVTDVTNALPDNENAEYLDNNWGELYSIILDVIEIERNRIGEIEE